MDKHKQPITFCHDPTGYFSVDRHGTRTVYADYRAYLNALADYLAPIAIADLDALFPDEYGRSEFTNGSAIESTDPDADSDA